MSDQKLTDLTVAVSLVGDEPVYIVQGGIDKQTTTQAIASLGGNSYFPSGW
jgi:hypothetical protein